MCKNVDSALEINKETHVYVYIDSKLHQYGLEYVSCIRDLYTYLSAYSHSVSGCRN